MVSHKQERATANLRMLEFVARKLGPLNEQVIYLGGCTTALFITDPLSLDVRPTKDVDCIIDIVSLPKYYQFGKKLSSQGFKQSIDDDDFRTALPGNLNDGPVTIQRIQTVQNRIKRIITG